MPGSAESAGEKAALLPPPTAQEELQVENMPVPSWHQPQQFLQLGRALNPSHPNFHVSPSAEELFLVPSWGGHLMGMLLQGS